MTLLQDQLSPKPNKPNAKLALKKLGKSVKEGMQIAIEKTAEGGKKLMSWWQEFLTKTKEKGLKASLMGVFVGFLNLLNKAGKKVKDTVKAAKDKLSEKSEPIESKASEARSELRKDIDLCDIPPKSIDIPESIKGTPEAIIMAAKILKERGIKANHCWNWTEKVYEFAGYYPKKRRGQFDSVRDYWDFKYKEVEPGKGDYIKDNKTGKYVKSKHGNYKRGERIKTPDCGKHHYLNKKTDQIMKDKGISRSEAYPLAQNSLLEILKPGDHIFINNRNSSDNGGNHSEIFLGWADKEKYQANVAGFGGIPPNRKPYIKTRYFIPAPGKKRDWRITKILQPVKKPSQMVA
jgi:hypothetical protein